MNVYAPSRTFHCPACGAANSTSSPTGTRVRCYACNTTVELTAPREGAGPGLGELLVGVAVAATAGVVITSLFEKALQRMDTHDVFISHAWTYNDGYYRLVGMLDADPDFTWRNHSVPEHDPLLGGSAWALERQLEAQVRQANVMLVIAGMYVNHREWIQKEIDMAHRVGIPIIGIEPWGSRVTPVQLRAAAHEMVGWRTKSIVDAVRRHG